MQDTPYRNWNLREHDSRAGNVESTREGLCRAASEAEAALSAADPRSLLEAERRMLTTVDPLLNVVALTRMTDNSSDGKRYLERVDGSYLRACRVRRQLSVALSKRLTSVDEAPDKDCRRFVLEMLRLASRRPSSADDGWETLADAHFNALEEVHRSLVSTSSWGTIDDAGEVTIVRRANVRRLRCSASSSVRAAVEAIEESFLGQHGGALAEIKRARMNGVSERARLYGHASVEAAAVDGARTTLGSFQALHSQRARVRDLARRYFAAKASRLGLPALGWRDTAASVGGPTIGLSLERVLRLLSELAPSYNPAYAETLDELARRPLILSDSGRAQIDAWFAVPHYGGGAPLLHVVDHGTTQSFAASAHEVGHCCQLSFLARHVGPFAAADAAVGFSELPALLFEIAAVNEAIARAAGADEQGYWRAAAFEQLLHFLLVLPTSAEFERRSYANPDLPLGRAWHEAVDELWPDNVVWPSGYQGYSLECAPENMPFSGDLYATTFALAYAVYLGGGEGYENFEREASYHGLAEATSMYLGHDLEASSLYGACLSHAESLLEELERQWS